MAPLEVILVIDNDSTLAEQATAVLAGVRVVENNRTPGLSGARNTGVAAAQGSIIAFSTMTPKPGTTGSSG